MNKPQPPLNRNTRDGYIPQRPVGIEDVSPERLKPPSGDSELAPSATESRLLEIVIRLGDRERKLLETLVGYLG